jgi:HK97 family phage major capsid protein
MGLGKSIITLSAIFDLYYNIGDRGSRSIAELKELFAGNGMVGFVAKERVDGKLVLPEAVKLLKMASA